MSTPLGPAPSALAPALCIEYDIADSARQNGADKLVFVNGHGGNYVLGNIVQEANAIGPRMALFPTRDEWDEARLASGMETKTSQVLRVMCKRGADPEARPRLCRCGSAQAGH
jgi:hypothetical protein